MIKKHHISEHLTHAERNAINRNNPDTIIKEADTEGAVFILDKSHYVQEVDRQLSNALSTNNYPQTPLRNTKKN